MGEPNLKSRTRSDYVYFLSYRTRWSNCGLDPVSSPLIGLVVSSYCQFFAPLGFPQVLDLGLRVNTLGNSSVSYEIGVFEQGKDIPAAVGGYTHVFVGSKSRKSTPMAKETKTGLEKLLQLDTKDKAKL
ncbi:thioesterase thiol ester dehydrase-isomerase [Gymnopilus junonius]|uniref:Thioesterase thiol ester dehydrase-isomerase n=1 Tax=Gymnopilus junonius TaxID=109634 RepID=A0A9P5TKL5_GYMJU|nr:thioesterase thiol ester dehydrase-isomerase [Gymnopilus junonius]